MFNISVCAHAKIWSMTSRHDCAYGVSGGQITSIFLFLIIKKLETFSPEAFEITAYCNIALNTRLVRKMLKVQCVDRIV